MNILENDRIRSDRDAKTAVFYGVLVRLIGLFTGPITMLLIASRFTQEDQGYYYTFINLLSLQVFVEMGLGTVIIQFAGHEWSKLHVDRTGAISGDSDALSRLISLARITFKWYFAGGLLVMAGLGIGGYLFFLHLPNQGVEWILPWIFLSILSGISLFLIPVWSLLEGCNQVAEVYAYRFYQGLIASVTIWISILAGGRMWTPSISVAVIFVYSLLFIRMKYWNYVKSLLSRPPTSSHLNWRTDILPFQWRIALSWISGYFCFYLFTPVLLKYQGAVIAGQMGMTWSLINLINLVAAAFISPKVPTFCMLIARREYQELDRLFWKLAKIVWSLSVLLSALLWLGVYLLGYLHIPLASRLIAPGPFMIFLLGQIFLTITVPFSYYLRSHKKEPLLFISLAQGILIALSILILGRHYSVSGMAIGYTAVNLLLIPWVVTIWHECRRKWHTSE